MKNKAPVPCTQCLTYTMCKDQYSKELMRQMGMTQQFSCNIDCMSQVEYKAYYLTLGKKCPYLTQFISFHQSQSNGYVQELVSYYMRKAFDITPNYASYISPPKATTT